MNSTLILSIIFIIGAALGALIAVLGAILNSYYRLERQGQGKIRIRRKRHYSGQPEH